MTPAEFVRLWRAEKDGLLAAYLDDGTATAVGTKIAGLGLTHEQSVILREVIDGVLSDAFYTLLLGLDGCASIGGEQVAYRLEDEDGNPLTGSGEIEEEAYSAFQEG